MLCALPIEPQPLPPKLKQYSLNTFVSLRTVSDWSKSTLHKVHYGPFLFLSLSTDYCNQIFNIKKMIGFCIFAVHFIVFFLPR